MSALNEPTDRPKPTLDQLVPNEGDIVIVIREHGRGLAAWVHWGDKIVSMPAKWEARFDASPVKTASGRLLAVTATVGWTQREWKAEKGEVLGT